MEAFQKAVVSISMYRVHYLTQRSSAVPYSGSISLENIKEGLGHFGYEQMDQVYLATVRVINTVLPKSSSTMAYDYNTYAWIVDSSFVV